MQLISDAGAAPQSVEQLQWSSAASQVPLPQQNERHCTSEQSAVPLQSSSMPSEQFVSDAGGVPQSAAQAAHPPHRSQAEQVPFGQFAQGTGKGPLRLMQSGSLHPTIPSQSWSWVLKMLQL
jgi:hypothetical protein